MPKTASAVSQAVSRAPQTLPAGPWWERAACQSADPELFFPVSGSGAAGLADIRRAKAVCRSCPVREQCLDYALDSKQAHGVWGGCSEDERRAIVVRHGGGQAVTHGPSA